MVYKEDKTGKFKIDLFYEDGSRDTYMLKGGHPTTPKETNVFWNLRKGVYVNMSHVRKITIKRLDT